MALTVELEPTDPALVRDPVPLVLESDRVPRLAGTAAVWTHTCSGGSADGDTVTVRWSTGTVVFECATTPEDNGTDFAVTASASACGAELRTIMALHPTIAELFTVGGTGADVVLTTRTTDIEATAPTASVSDVGSWAETTAGTDTTYYDNHQVVVRLEMEDTWMSNTYARKCEVAATCSTADSRARFDLGGLIRPYLEQARRDTSPWPWLDSYNPVVAGTLQRRVKVYAWESEGDPPAPRTMITAYDGYAWWAGIGPRWVGSTQNVLDGVGASSMKFLTYRGRRGPREVTRTERHWLSWRNHSTFPSPSTLYVQARMNYSDGTDSGYSNVGSIADTGFKPKDILHVPVGYGILNLSGIDSPPVGETTTGYTIKLLKSSGSVDVSEEYTFTLVDAHAQEQSLWWFNSLGHLEVLRCTGAWELGTELEVEDLYRPMQVGDAMNTYAEHAYRARAGGQQQVLRLSTGLLPYGEILPLADLLNAQENGLRWLDKTNGALLPARIVEAKAVLAGMGDDDEHLYALNLEVLVGDPTNLFSDAPMLT